MEGCGWRHRRAWICAPKPLNLPGLTTSSVWISRQTYSAYAVHLTTLSPPALVGDAALVWLLWKAVQTWTQQQQQLAVYTLLVWMFVSKFSKNLGHYVRYPSDVALLPVSILFGWFHGLIKLYAMATLDVVSTPPHFRPFPYPVLSSAVMLAAQHFFCFHMANSLIFCSARVTTEPHLPARGCLSSPSLTEILDNLGQSSWSRHQF